MGDDLVDTHHYRIGEKRPSELGKNDFVGRLLDPRFNRDIVVFDRKGFVNYGAARAESYEGFCHILDTTVMLNCNVGTRVVATITGRDNAVVEAKSKIEDLTGYELVEVDPHSSGRDKGRQD